MSTTNTIILVAGAVVLVITQSKWFEDWFHRRVKVGDDASTDETETPDDSDEDA